VSGRLRSLLATHLAVALFGMAGLFGKLLALSPLLIVLGRTFFAALVLIILMALLRMRRARTRLPTARELPAFALLGALLAIHWTTFFHSIQLSTVAIGLLTYSSFPIFVTFLEPLVFGGRVYRQDLSVSLVVFTGLALVIPEFDLANRSTVGALWGVLSGFTFALLSVLNRKLVVSHAPLTIACLQNGFAFASLLPFGLSATVALTMPDLGLLAVLGVVFTALAHTLFITGLRGITAQLASVISSLEPIYGILLAVLLLHEMPSARQVVGGAVIIGTIIYATRRSRRTLTD
jgi:drug/metabolite transporter (DMT)-like permease